MDKISKMLTDFKDNLVTFATPVGLEAINVDKEAKTRGSYRYSSNFINFKKNIKLIN